MGAFLDSKGLQQAIQYLSREDREKVLEAIDFATKLHKDQRRSSGEPYITHPLEVAEFLCGLHAGRDTLIAALLHDAVEDGHCELKDILTKYGKTVALLVDGVTKLSKLEYAGQRNLRQVASLRKMLLSAQDDLRVIFIKLADRWHNIKTLEHLPEEKQMRIAKETLDIYVPFARLVGLWSIKTIFEDACFPIAYPEESKRWETAVQKMRTAVQNEREHFVKMLNKNTEEDVQAELIRATDYEIYTKFQGNIARVSESRSIDSVLVTIKNAKDDSSKSELLCYSTLGEIHKQYPVLTGSFRDYISAPQPNGYKALHTTIFLSQNNLIRLRIQTQFMFEYVTNRRLKDWVLDPEGNTKSALEILRMVSRNPDEYMDALKNNVLSRTINVFTTSGEVIALPSGSTGIDFAFALNPDHLRYLSGIRINGESSEPTKKINDGDTVELILSANSNGNGMKHLWLDRAQSVQVKQELRKSIKHTNTNYREADAKEMLNVELQKYRLSAKPIFTVKSIQNKLVKQLHRATFDEVVSDMSTGILPISEVVSTYKNILSESHNWFVHILRWFHLLPKSRIHDEKSQLIDIHVYAEDRPGLIHDVTRCFADRSINIAKFEVFALPKKGALYQIRLEAKNFDVFSDLYDALFQVPSIQKIERKR